MSELTRLEEQILLSVWRLEDNAYGLTIYEHIQKITDREMAIGGIYYPLERLVKNGLLEAVKGDPTPVRGGRSKRFYRLTELGKTEMLKAKKAHDKFWKDLPLPRVQKEKIR
jgi:DNA-binding PadR family transcriptional regulator